MKTRCNVQLMSLLALLVAIVIVFCSHPVFSEESKPLKPSDPVVQRAELWRITLSYNRISSMLRNSEKWLRIAEIRDPKTERDEVLKKLVSLKNDLAMKMNKLRRSVKSFSSPNGVLIRGDFEPTREDLEELHQAWYVLEKLLDKRLRRLRLRGPEEAQPPPLGHITSECGTWSILRVPEDPSYYEILAPQLSVTQSERNFTRLKTEDWDGVSFKDMFIDVGDADIFVDDAFEVASVFSFTSPKAPCDGRFSYFLDGRLVFSPDLEADSGLISVFVYYWIHKEADQRDPLRHFQFGSGNLIQHPWHKPSFNYTHQEPTPNWLDVRKDERAVVNITVKVKMSVAGGRASFSQWGEEPRGHFVFRKPLGGSKPGILFAFEPSG